MKVSDRRHRISNTTDRREEKGGTHACCVSKVPQQGVPCFSKASPCFSKASRTTTARHSGRFQIVRNRLRHYASPQIRPCYIVRDRVRRSKSGRLRPSLRRTRHLSRATTVLRSVTTTTQPTPSPITEPHAGIGTRTSP